METLCTILACLLVAGMANAVLMGWQNGWLKNPMIIVIIPSKPTPTPIVLVASGDLSEAREPIGPDKKTFVQPRAAA